VASLEGYGAPVIDIGHWFMESDLTAVVGVLRNFVPERLIAATGAMARTNIDDGLRVQEVINAVEISHHERRWVSLPLDGEGGAAR